MFQNFLFKSTVTDYINKIRIDSVIFDLLPDVCETFISFYRFFYQSRKVSFSVFCSVNHQTLKLPFFAWKLYFCLIIFEIKNPREIYLETPPKINTIPPNPTISAFLFSNRNWIVFIHKLLSLFLFWFYIFYFIQIETLVELFSERNCHLLPSCK